MVVYCNPYPLSLGKHDDMEDALFLNPLQNKILPDTTLLLGEFGRRESLVRYSLMRGYWPLFF